MIRAEKIKGNDGKWWIKASFRSVKTLVDAMSQVKGAIYSPAQKVWAIPLAFREDFESKMGGFLINWTDEEKRSNGGISEDDIPSEPTVPGYGVTYNEHGEIIDHRGFKTRPWGEFQVKGFNLMVSKDFLILADDAGLGKSWQVANAIEAKKKLGHLKRGIVLAKASLLFNWRDEIHMHTNLKSVVMAGTVNQRAKLYNQLTNDEDWDVIIMSYETFRCDIHNLELLDNYRELQFCVMDEAHKIKNPNSKIGSLIHRINFRSRYVLTATPLPNSPIESFNYLRFGKRTDYNWWQFQARYAIMGGFNGKEIVGYQNIMELKNLIQINMLRRRKKDKLKELPEVAFKKINLSMTPTQSKLYQAVKEEITEELKDTSLDRIPSALTKLLRLQQVTDSIELIGVSPGKNTSSKLLALDEMIEELVDSGEEKVIIFSRFRTMVELIEKRYSKYQPAVIHGDVDANGKTENSAVRILKKKYRQEWYDMPEEQKRKLLDETMTSDRQKEVYRFQNDNDCKIFIGCTPACREGLTLTKATHVIFLDCEWSPAYVEQAFSRAHRIGQQNAVTVYYLVCEGTIDEHVQETLQRKEAMAQTMLDEGINNLDLGVAKQIIASLAGIDERMIT
ncbi:DEAD/DEAH box helicase [Brevibacillus laterosporus]|uniref:DEAD/DEAH box helicase n=1 Tax=Brevibacillus laterosporus TaxID=1465 RepID=UPI0003686AF4|nr:DEAD/DEAH box helicase [Brevibacillus laterosporus]ATO48627.1 hypothetical protein BrL25_05545 [Brevibacillus laterosporus DSM 25]MED2002470.1 DEAD/DEAH box helicase [Brevibacillus laterosporus]